VAWASLTNEKGAQMKWGQWFWRAAVTLGFVLVGSVAAATWKPASEAIRTGTATYDLAALACAGVITLIIGGIGIALKDR
jgi:hypothetical protein